MSEFLRALLALILRDPTADWHRYQMRRLACRAEIDLGELTVMSTRLARSSPWTVLEAAEVVAAWRRISPGKPLVNFADTIIAAGMECGAPSDWDRLFPAQTPPAGT